MNKIPKWHIVFAALFALGLIGMNLIPTILKAASDDIEAFQESNVEVYRITKGGKVVTSSGVASSRTLWVNQVHWFNLSRASASAVVNPEGLVSTTSLFGNGSLTAGVTTYVDNTSTSNVIQPIVARTLAFKVQAGTGVVVIKGTDTFGNPVTEVLPMPSTQSFAVTFHAYLGISSFTIRLTTLTDVLNTQTTYYVGYSSGMGVPYRIDNASDVVRVSSSAPTLLNGGQALTTPTQWVANVLNNTITISTSLVNGLSNFTAHVISRRTVHSAKP